MPIVHANADLRGPAALMTGIVAVAGVQLVGGAPLAGAVALCAWGVFQGPRSAAAGSRRLATTLCPAVAVLAICAQLDLLVRAVAPLWRGALAADLLLAVVLLGDLVRQAVRR